MKKPVIRNKLPDRGLVCRVREEEGKPVVPIEAQGGQKLPIGDECRDEQDEGKPNWAFLDEVAQTLIHLFQFAEALIQILPVRRGNGREEVIPCPIIPEGWVQQKTLD